YLGTLSWLLRIPLSYTPIGGWVALAGYLAIYPGVWVWLCWRIYPAKIPRQWNANFSRQLVKGSEALPDKSGVQGLVSGNSRSFTELLEWYLSVPWSQRLGWSIF